MVLEDGRVGIAHYDRALGGAFYGKINLNRIQCSAVRFNDEATPWGIEQEKEEKQDQLLVAVDERLVGGGLTMIKGPVKLVFSDSDGAVRWEEHAGKSPR